MTSEDSVDKDESFAKKSVSLKKIGVIIAILAIISYASMFVLIGTTKSNEQGFVASVTYYPKVGSLSIVFEDTLNQTKGGSIFMTKTNGENWNLGNFTGSLRQSFLMMNANQTHSMPQTVTFNLVSTDDSRYSKTFQVKIYEKHPN